MDSGRGLFAVERLRMVAGLVCLRRWLLTDPVRLVLVVFGGALVLVLATGAVGEVGETAVVDDLPLEKIRRMPVRG